MLFQFQNIPDGAFCVRMQQGTCVQRPFEMVYNARAPLPYEELQGILEELNHVLNKKFPPCLKALPTTMFITGFILMVFGGFIWVDSSGEDFSLSAIGFGLFIGGMVSGGCLGSCGNAAISALRTKLNEINARYQGRGIDFDLHTSSHLEMYTRSSEGYGRRRGIRTVMDYTLVVQNIQVVGANRIPASHAIANQALSGAGFGAAPPPMYPPNMQQPMQAPLIAGGAYPQQPMQAPPLEVAPANHMPVAQAMVAPQLMTVTCPPGAAPGTTVQVQAPDGRLVAVQVPAGVAPGAQFQAQL